MLTWQAPCTCMQSGPAELVHYAAAGRSAVSGAALRAGGADAGQSAAHCALLQHAAGLQWLAACCPAAYCLLHACMHWLSPAVFFRTQGVVVHNGAAPGAATAAALLVLDRLQGSGLEARTATTMGQLADVIL